MCYQNNAKFDAVFESYEKSAKINPKKLKVKGFAHSNKSQKLDFSLTFSLITFFLAIFYNFFYGFEIGIKFCVL
jgi:hypothetical protein